MKYASGISATRAAIVGFMNGSTNKSIATQMTIPTAIPANSAAIVDVLREMNSANKIPEHDRKSKLNASAGQHRHRARDQRFNPIHQRTERLERHGHARTGDARIGHHESHHQDGAEYSVGDPGGESPAPRNAIHRSARINICRV